MGVHLSFGYSVTAKIKQKIKTEDNIVEYFGCGNDHPNVSGAKFCPQCGKKYKKIEVNNIISKFKTFLENLYDSDGMTDEERELYEENYIMCSTENNTLRFLFDLNGYFELPDTDDGEKSNDTYYLSDEYDDCGYRYMFEISQDMQDSVVNFVKQYCPNVLNWIEKNFGEYTLLFTFVRYYG